MKLKIHTPNQHPNHVRTSDPKVSINRKSGLISLNIMLVEKLSLSEGDKVSLVQDEDKPSDWYLIKDPNGFQIRKHPASSGMTFNSSSLAKEVLDSLNILDSSTSIKVDTAPVMHDARKLYPLATRLVMKTSSIPNRMTA